MSYLVLARKYRPQRFEDLVGQDHVATTLANAIGSGRIAHAFLFTGVRGVGKTTSARLLAKCLNCIGPDGTRKDATATPCQECAPCKEIAAGNDLDVLEIDGASYNGVDEVRRLQEGLAFRPARDRYKIFIVDEVHMLSNAAWNAFLKTLEEPPPHVKFIFATTEVHKVPVTILSRCQRYDFKLIRAARIASRLSEVLRLESIEAEDAAVAMIAREAAGSMRDAMSLIDQVIAFSGARLTAPDVSRVLGVAERGILHELAAALVHGQAPVALEVVHRLSEQGFDLAHVSKDVLHHLRNLVVAKVCGENKRELLDVAAEEADELTTLAASATEDDLVRLHQGFSRSFDEIVRSPEPRAALEMTLVRLCKRPPLLPLDELLGRLADLERRLGGGGPPASPSPVRGGGGRAPNATGSGATAVSAGMSSAPGSAPTNLRTLPVPTLAAAKAVASAAPAPVTMGALAIAAPKHDAAATVDMEAWRALLDAVRADAPAIASLFDHGVPLEVSRARVLVGFERGSFLAIQASEADTVEALRQKVRARFGPDTVVALDVSLKPGSVAAQPTIATVDAEARAKSVEDARAAVLAHPLVAKAVRVLGAEVKDIKLAP